MSKRPHAWSRDPARDAAVRAAEDGRTGPLPTLKECIAGVTETMSEIAIGKEMEQGMRTERVVLEITTDSANGPLVEHWYVQTIRNLRKDRDTLKARVAELEAADVAGMGNSVGYWYAKAKAYGDIVQAIGPRLGRRDDETLVEAADRFIAEHYSPQAASGGVEVVKPSRWGDMRYVIADQRDAEWIAAIAKAGVPVKEVG